MTPRQEQTLATIARLRGVLGRDPTLRELARELDVTTCTTRAHVRALIEQCKLGDHLDPGPTDEVLHLVGDVQRIIARGRADAVSARHLRARLLGGRPHDASIIRWWKAIRVVVGRDHAGRAAIPDLRQLDVWTRVTRATGGASPAPPRQGG